MGYTPKYPEKLGIEPGYIYDSKHNYLKLNGFIFRDNVWGLNV